MNKVTILAALSRIAFSATTGGTSTAEGTLALTREYATPSGEVKRGAVFLPFQAIGSAADALKEIPVGSAISTEGLLSYEEWFAKDSGVKRSRVRLRVNNPRQAIGEQFITDNGAEGPTVRLDGGFANATLFGKVVGAPTIKETKGGKMLSLTVETHERYRDATGQATERKHLVSAVLWREQAQAFIDQGGKAGMNVMLTGELHNESWGEEGNKRYALRVHGASVQVTLPVVSAAAEATQSAAGEPVVAPVTTDTATEQAIPDAVLEAELADMPF